MRQHTRTREMEDTSNVRSELRQQTAKLFAPMECSVADAVMGCISRTQYRRRRIESLVLGFSPVVAVALVLVLYLGAGVVPWGTGASAPVTPLTSAPLASGQRLGFAPQLDKSSTAALVSPVWNYTVDVRGDRMRRQLLASWLMSGHGDAACQLSDVEAAQSLVLDLAPDEASDLEAFLMLHHYVVEEQSGLERTAAWHWTGRDGDETGHVTIRIIG